MASGPITSWEIDGETVETVADFIWGAEEIFEVIIMQWEALFFWAPKSLQIVTAAMKLKDTCSLEEKLWQTLDSVLKSRDFIFLGSKITADGDCSCEIKRYLLLGRNAMTNLDSILKSRDITLPTKVRLV